MEEFNLGRKEQTNLNLSVLKWTNSKQHCVGEKTMMNLSKQGHSEIHTKYNILEKMNKTKL